MPNKVCHYCATQYYRRNLVEIWEPSPGHPGGVRKRIVRTCLDCEGIAGLFQSRPYKRRGRPPLRGRSAA